MEKVICPTDFSTAANNAIEYAAKFAQHHRASLEIMHLQQVSALEPVLSGREVIRQFEDASALMEKMSRKISSTFDISCSYSVEVSSRDLEKVMRGKSAEKNILIIGTNGTDELYQYFFGTNSYHVARKSKCPVLIVPEGAAFAIPRKIIFAWDYDQSCKDAFLQLKDFSGSDATEITFLHVSRKKTPVSDEVFRALKNEVLSCTGESKEIKFKRIYSAHADNFAMGIDEYFKDSKADLLSITHYKRRFPAAAFHGTILKALSETATYPLLILHS